MERKSVNPFFVGAEFLQFCVRSGYLEFVLGEDKRVHYYLTESGARELPERFGFSFDKPCAFHEDE